MTTKAVADALVAWADATLPALTGTYSYPPDKKTQALPDVAVEITDVDLTTSDRRFPRRQIEQARLKVWEAELLFVVTPEPAQAASEQLYGFIDSLSAAVLADPSLGGRVEQADRDPSFSLRPAFVEFDDGSRGRLLTMTIAVAETQEV